MSISENYILNILGLNKELTEDYILEILGIDGFDLFEVADYLGDDLFLFESNKWEKLMKAGKLSKSALRKIQRYKGKADPLRMKQLAKTGKAVKADPSYVKQLLKKKDVKGAEEYLKKKGIVKSARSWIAGIEKGFKNILQKHGVSKVTNKPHTAWAAAAGASGQKGIKAGKDLTKTIQSHSMVKSTGKASIHLPKTTSKNRLGRALMGKHETDEITSSLKSLKRQGAVAQSTLAGTGAIDSGVMTKASSHVSDEVLKQEKKLVDLGKKLYGKKLKKGDMKEILKYRKATGEYADIDKMKKMPKKLLKQAQAQVEKANADAVKDMLKQSKNVRKVATGAAKKSIKQAIIQQHKAGLVNKKDYHRAMSDFKKDK